MDIDKTIDSLEAYADMIKKWYLRAEEQNNENLAKILITLRTQIVQAAFDIAKKVKK